jgi:hypothetical protein
VAAGDGSVSPLAAWQGYTINLGAPFAGRGGAVVGLYAMQKAGIWEVVGGCVLGLLLILTGDSHSGGEIPPRYSINVVNFSDYFI